ncbi:DMT family transporter [Bartonella sp. AC67GZZY]|uniref:DMT family transporter n=1 Tax=Bartonella sp. AC67GZZY TaxID=3243459 RepID=UPI0035CF59DA
MKITPRIALVLTLVGTFFWGSNFQATKIALTTVSPWTASFERFLIAVIAIFLIMIFKEGLRWHVLSQNFISYIFLGIIGVAGFNGALFVGLQTSNPITASLIMATTPISANIIEAIMNKSFPTCERVIGMLISMFGVYLVITNGRFLSNHVSFAKGDIMILLGSVGWAFYTVGTRSFVKNATPLETTSWTMLSGTVALGVLTFLFESPFQETMSMSGASLFALLWMGVAGSVLAYLFWNIGIAIRGPGKTAIFFNFVPISALLVQILFGFIPQIMQIIGVFVTIFGVLIGQGYIFSLLGSRKAVPNAHKE